MIATLLVEYSWAVPLLFAAMVLVCVGIGALLLRSPVRGPLLTRALAIVAGAAVVALTLLPSSGEPERFCTFAFAWPAWGAVETLANIALLFPVTFFAALAVRRPFLTGLMASVVSAAIELIQALVPAIGRSCDTTDWEMNTIGAILAAVLAWVTIAWLSPAESAADPGLDGGRAQGPHSAVLLPAADILRQRRHRITSRPARGQGRGRCDSGWFWFWLVARIGEQSPRLAPYRWIHNAKQAKTSRSK